VDTVSPTYCEKTGYSITSSVDQAVDAHVLQVGMRALDLFDHLVGGDEGRGRHGQAKVLGRFGIDEQFEL